MSIRACVLTLASLALAFAISTPARADVRSIDAVQTLPRPAGYTAWGTDVAIDGGYIIVLAGTDGSQSALLYRRNLSDGQWVFRHVLWTYTGPFVRSDVAMKNNIAAVQFGDNIQIFELSGGDYVAAPSTAPIRHQGGVAISGNSVLIGGNDCDDDAVIYQKNAAGSWAITGRIDDNQGQCLDVNDLASVEMYGDYAIVHSKNASEAHAWRRNGTALDWVPAGTLAFLPDELSTNENFALQGATAVAPNGVVWLRTGSSTWTRQGVLLSVDRDNANGFMSGVKYRNGVLIVNEFGRFTTLTQLYIEASPGHFEHVGSLRTYQNITRYDLANRTVVATVTDVGSTADVRVFTLPAQMRAPAPVVNDFEDRDASDFTFNSGQFALAARGSDDVLAQNSTSGLAIATLTDTDWTDYQKVQADITPSFNGTGSWVGLVARYVDANNYYYLAIRAEKTWGIYKRVNGVDTLLAQGSFYNTMTPTFRPTLAVDGNRIIVDFGFQQGPTITDNSLTHGRGGVATWLARADFDDVHVAATDVYSLFEREYGAGGSDYESGLDEISGRWQVIEISDPEESSLAGLAQFDTSGDARAVIGTPVANQDLITRMRVDSFGASQQGSWAGLLARYVDANNFYYVTI
ncbi:MAG TPA: hypothetical protein VGQ27_00935, partial [Steroidobacteraceae bacterium]|nr:hypothetical protein [Steroidobacteraceae bacterium]